MGIKRTCLPLFMAFVAAVVCNAAEIGVPEDAGRINICPYLEVFEDASGALGLLELLQPARKNQFVPANSRRLTLGVTPSAYWLRFQPKLPKREKKSAQINGRMTEGQWLIEIDRFWIPTLALWVPVDGDIKAADRWRQLRPLSAGMAKRFGLLNRNCLFFFPRDYDSDRPMYLKMASWGPPLNFSMHIVSLNAYRNRMSWDLALFGIICGAMAAVVFYSALIYVTLRDRTYLFYGLSILAMAVYLAFDTGFLSALTGITPGGLYFVVYWISGVSIFFAAWFCRIFLLTPHHAPLVDKALRVPMALAVVWAISAFLGFYHLAHALNGLTWALFPLTVIAAGYMQLKSGFRPVVYFLTGWCVLAVGNFFWGLQSTGAIVQAGFVSWAFPGAVALASILLFAALAERRRLLRQEIQEEIASERRLRVMSNTDGLSRLFNKRYFDKKLNSEISMAEHLHGTLSLLVLDIDDFSNINNAYGHQMGNQVIRRLGRVVRQSVRSEDCACRYGGEEFIVILPGVDLKKARSAAERIHRAMAENEFRTDGGVSFTITISIGMAEWRYGESSSQLIKRAENALYCAKQRGKNRITA